MKLLLCTHLIWSLISSAELSDGVDRKIFHGDPVKLEELPFMARLFIPREDGRYVSCGGAYVHVYWVLSSDHCIVSLVKGGKVKICMGEEETVRCRSTEHIRYSKEIISGEPLADLIMMRLARPFKLGPKIQIGRLPALSENVTRFDNEKCVAAGWGITENKRLSAGYLCVISKKQGPCKGDSGTPLMCKGIIVGVLSHGSRVECGFYGNLIFYVSVIKYCGFIRDTIDGKYDSSAPGRLKMFPVLNLLILAILLYFK